MYPVQKDGPNRNLPYRDPHTAAPCLWAIRHEAGPALEVSHVSATELEDEQQRKGLETTFITLHRHATDRSPTANFGRITDGYKQSSYSYSDPPFKGGLLAEGDEEPNAERGIEPPSWHQWKTPRARGPIDRSHRTQTTEFTIFSRILLPPEFY